MLEEEYHDQRRDTGRTSASASERRTRSLIYGRYLDLEPFSNLVHIYHKDKNNCN